MSIPPITIKSTDKKKNCLNWLQKYEIRRIFPNRKPYDLTFTSSFMLLFRWRSGSHLAVAMTSVLALLSGCGPTRYAYFQPQHNAVHHLAPALADLTASIDTLPVANEISLLEPRSSTDANVVSVPSASSARVTARATLFTRHSNPDSYHTKRINTLLSTIPIAHVAPRRHLIDRHSANRKTHPLALVALGLSVIAYAPLVLTGTGTLLWVIGLTLPLAAVLLGVASLTTINRNKDRYRGKGWAMAAIVLGTGVLGLALLAAAALSVSKVLWEK